MSAAERVLDRLLVIDRLVVGPAKIEPRRITTPYQVVVDGRVEQIDFIYRWEEDVFSPDAVEDQNLAALIGSQVALNYGLFCRQIVLQGLLDGADRAFLTKMMENTSREIWVHKIVADNPFLAKGVRPETPVRSDRYTRAEVRFDEGLPGSRPAPWNADAHRHAVLSSGGKDSLLTLGLLREIGVEVHPVFVNESGRHWYTALNAYRHFRDHVPHTARLWTNCDRVFSWMLRHLALVRPDFVRVRSDIYPIRLWTVAVFLFGALPLLRKRAVGNIVIGNQYDTSARGTRHGITHYDGVYDQSRWFDAALTRFFHRKGWGVSQFSVLRPLSELLIQQILSKRYPDLLRHQVSCHAAHLEGERAHPCGNCEKCRRIVGLLTAIGADPHVCGYTDVQIRRCLDALPTRSVNQEAAGVSHLLAILAEKGVIPPVSGARRRPEIDKIRIDPERSPLDVVPLGIRLRSLEIFGEHAEGAVRRQGRLWIDLDIRNDPEVHRPFPFDRRSADGNGMHVPEALQGVAAESGGRKRFHILGELTWPEARDRLKRVDLALLPIGALEQHGPHSPLDTDSFDAQHLAERVAESCTEPRPFVLPLVPYGISYHHEDFPGTFSVTNETLARFVYEIGLSAARNGISKLVIVNGHGGNAPTLQFAAQMINRDAHIFACVDSGETSDADIATIVETRNDVHAGEIETSTTLAVRPHLVNMARARKCVPRFSSSYLDFSGKRSVEWYARTKKISSQGVLGDPTRASREKGQRIWETMTRNLVELVEHLKRMTLDEIYEKKY
jgi:creatinine amidohydrolase/Fe(II)-dependent formamide hydrolase-like protein/7-cyano-7-deazaguanine synthase in queuosine biosynthesis